MRGQAAPTYPRIYQVPPPPPPKNDQLTNRGGNVCHNKQNDGPTVSQIPERKFQQREIDLDQEEEELRSRYRFDRELMKYLVEILKDDLQRQTTYTVANFSRQGRSKISLNRSFKHSSGIS